MSEFRDILSHIVSDREAGTVELCKNLKNGRTFFAEIEQIQDTELNTELGRDAREAVLMHISNRAVAGEIFLRQQIQVTLYGQAITFEVCRRQDNPADPQVEFGLMKFTDKDS